eukprot:COSAG02_NODE_3956_length_5986_cov_18.502633_6_plen_266_part_00
MAAKSPKTGVAPHVAIPQTRLARWPKIPGRVCQKRSPLWPRQLFARTPARSAQHARASGPGGPDTPNPLPLSTLAATQHHAIALQRQFCWWAQCSWPSLAVWARRLTPTWVTPGKGSAPGDATARVAPAVQIVTPRAEWRGLVRPPTIDRTSRRCGTPTGGAATVTPTSCPLTTVPARTDQACVVPLVPTLHKPSGAQATCTQSGHTRKSPPSCVRVGTHLVGPTCALCAGTAPSREVTATTLARPHPHPPLQLTYEKRRAEYGR